MIYQLCEPLFHHKNEYNQMPTFSLLTCHLHDIWYFHGAFDPLIHDFC